mmetsp:Transcript_134541/g.238030  ORF Transcript_134541/g.238030 Transcript_134541/m.238030 type:complete len:162 (+) Transcript_134541:1777-2262(+)
MLVVVEVVLKVVLEELEVDVEGTSLSISAGTSSVGRELVLLDMLLVPLPTSSRRSFAMECRNEPLLEAFVSFSSLSLAGLPKRLDVVVDVVGLEVVLDVVLDVDVVLVVVVDVVVALVVDVVFDVVVIVVNVVVVVSVVVGSIKHEPAVKFPRKQDEGPLG